MGTMAHYLEVNVPAETTDAWWRRPTTGSGARPEIEV